MNLDGQISEKLHSNYLLKNSSAQNLIGQQSRYNHDFGAVSNTENLIKMNHIGTSRKNSSNNKNQQYQQQQSIINNLQPNFDRESGFQYDQFELHRYSQPIQSFQDQQIKEKNVRNGPQSKSWKIKTIN